jgi:hypothetical protein
MCAPDRIVTPRHGGVADVENQTDKDDDAGAIARVPM